MLDILAYGVPVMDLLVNIDHPVAPDESIDINQTSWQYGGKVSTGIVAAARLYPGDYAMAGVTGGVIGQLIRHEFVRHGIDVSHLKHYPDRQSQFCVCMSILSNKSRNLMIHRQDAPYPSTEELDAAFIQSATYLFLADARPYSIQAAKIAHQAQTKVVYDADKYYPEGMPEMLAECDYLISSEFTHAHLFPNQVPTAYTLQQMQKMARKEAVVVVTLGEKGLVGIDETGGFFALPAYPVEVVDTTGAGDVFHGAFIAALLRQMPVQEACRFASAAAAIKCTRIGGRACIPTYEVCRAFMETGVIDYTELDQRIEYYSQPPFIAKV